MATSEASLSHGPSPRIGAGTLFDPSPVGSTPSSPPHRSFMGREVPHVGAKRTASVRGGARHESSGVRPQNRTVRPRPAHSAGLCPAPLDDFRHRRPGLASLSETGSARPRPAPGTGLRSAPLDDFRQWRPAHATPTAHTQATTSSTRGGQGCSAPQPGGARGGAERHPVTSSRIERPCEGTFRGGTSPDQRSHRQNVPRRNATILGLSP